MFRRFEEGTGVHYPIPDDGHTGACLLCVLYLSITFTILFVCLWFIIHYPVMMSGLWDFIRAW